MNHLVSIFKKNSFQKKVLTKINKRKEKIENSIWIIPYIKGISEKIERKCRQFNIIVIFKYKNNIRKSLMNVKTKHDINERVGVVYRIPCSQCNYCYTGRTLSTRIKEHKYAITTGNMNNALARHAWEAGHIPKWSDSKVLAFEQEHQKKDHIGNYSNQVYTTTYSES